MTIRYINIGVGQMLPGGTYATSNKGHTTAQTGQISVAWDDTVITNVNQFKAAFAEALLAVGGLGSIAKGS